MLDNGHIAGLGTHDELMQTCDIYRDTYQSQNRMSEEDAEAAEVAAAPAEAPAQDVATQEGGAADAR